MTALALGRKGFDVLVLEEAEEFGVIGYGIQLGPNVFWMLDRLGVADAVLAKALRPKALVMYDWIDGGVIARIPTGESFLQRFKKPYVVIHRVDLHQVLLDACRALPNVHDDRQYRGQVVRGSGRPRAGRYRGRPALSRARH